MVKPVGKILNSKAESTLFPVLSFVFCCFSVSTISSEVPSKVASDQKYGKLEKNLLQRNSFTKKKKSTLLTKMGK